MKKTNFLIVICLMTLSIFGACSKSDVVSDKIQLTIVEDDNGLYELTAHFSDYKNDRVQEAVNEVFNPEKVFKAQSDKIKSDIMLQDGTKFYLKASNGSLYIKFNKSENSPASYNRMQRLFESVKKAVN